MEQLTGKELQEKLTWKFPHIGQKTPERVAEAAVSCKRHKELLDRNKTERECVNAVVEMLRKTGYVEFEPGKCYQPGGKVYVNNRGKVVIATTCGTKLVVEGIRINGAHIDSPRLDSKLNPLYEKSEIASFKIHCYSGIREYRWGMIPLAMHGVVIRKDGEAVEISLGEKPGNLVFYMMDSPPYLSGEQNEREFHEGLKGRELNIMVGSMPYVDEKELKEPVKLPALKLLYEQYGITEGDFMRVEIGMVLAHKVSGVGLDRSLVGAYGQDDRACAYTAPMAEIEMVNPVYTTVTILTGKGEIGSVGNTGLNSNYARDYITYLAEAGGADPRQMFRNSVCLSSDVNAAFDLTLLTMYDTYNSRYMNEGCVLVKHADVRGEPDFNDTGAESMVKAIKVMGDIGMYWQIGELGTVDAGGGGIITQYMVHPSIDVADPGVPILSTHALLELASKLDVYSAHRVPRAFYTVV